uniref:Uncharacterized protein n=2 Tax=Panagrolaimus sp. ES5 TaxID=591445 RepID=A0AC34GAK1_9BILA
MASSTKTAQCNSGKSGQSRKHHGGQSAPPVQQSMMQSPTTMRKPPSDAKSTYAGKENNNNNVDAGKESQQSSEASLRTAKRKRKGKIEIRKQKKKGFGLFSKDDHSGNVSQEASIQTPSAQLSAGGTDAPESRAALKMIDTIPNDRTKIGTFFYYF